MLVRPRGIQDDLFPRLVVDVVGARSSPLHSDPPKSDEHDDEQYIEQHRDADPHEMLPRDVKVAGYDGRGEGRIAAVQTGHVRRTDAPIRADLIDAGAAVRARIRVALVDVGLATFTDETLTFADRTVVTLLAHAAVDARIRIAISAVLAAFAAEIRPNALADVIAILRHDLTTAAVEAGRRGAWIRVDFAGETGESIVTLTLVAVAAHVFAGTAVLTGLRAADARWHQNGRCVAAELDLSLETLEDRDAAGATHVQRHGHPGDPDVVHAAEETALHVLKTDDRRMLSYLGAQI